MKHEENNLLRWLFIASCIIIVLFLGLWPMYCGREVNVGFAVMEQDELKAVQDCLAKHEIFITMTSGRINLNDGTKFVRGHDKTGALWILVVTEPRPGMVKIEQHRCKPPMKGELP